MGFLPVVKRIAKAFPGLEVTVAPSFAPSLSDPFAQVGFPGLEVTRSIAIYGDPAYLAACS